jgi:hypothetical protein
MKESFVDSDRAIVANDQSAKVTEPSQGAFHFPAINSIPRVANRSRSGSLS